MQATGYLGDAFPGMTFRLQVPLLPMVNTSFCLVALPNVCSCCFQGDKSSESILNIKIIVSFCVDVDE